MRLHFLPRMAAAAGRTLLLALALAVPAQADTAGVVADHARPGYAAFAAQAQALAALETCDPGPLQQAFHRTYDAWLAVAHLHLGPAETDGRALAVLFWPDPKGLGWKAQLPLLTGDPQALTPEALARQSVAARGLSGLERLLFPSEALPADPCPLIRATADDLAATAQLLAAEWGPFGELLLSAGEPGNTRFLTRAEATQALFTQLATGLEFIADRRLGRPLATFDKPRPELAEARASGRSLRNVTLSLQALRDLAQDLNPDSPRTLAALDRAIALAKGLDDPRFDRLTDPQGWLKVRILQDAVRAARAAAVEEIGPALGVSVGFNAQDGD
jgi:hypothetical protein